MAAWGGSGANNSTRKARPHSKNVALPNSGRAKSPPQVCDDSLRRIPSYSLFAAGAWSRPRSGLPMLLWTKNEPRCGIDTRARGPGHGYYLLLRKVLFEENRKFPGRTAGWDRCATLVSDYWLILPPPWALFPPPCAACPPPPPLASLFGFRSRTSTCGLSFFSSLILPFLVC